MALILRDKKNNWKNGTIPFEIKEEDFTSKALTNIDKAILHWNTKTEWKIIPRDKEEDYVVFKNGDSCHSDVGRKGGKQVITLANNCGLGASIHEIGHCVGFKHEHTRNDRDNYVVVMKDRVRPDKVGNFKKVSIDKYKDYGNYDYESIMHYAKSSFRKINETKLGRGWSSSEFYRTSEGLNLFLLKKSGEVKIYRLGQIFVGREIERMKWTKDWTTVKFYEINGKTYQFILKEKGKSASGHNVITHKVNADGSIGKLVKKYNYSEGWTNVEFYKVNGVTYRFMLKKKGFSSFDKNVHIDKMNNNGSVGRKVEYYKWTGGWTSVKFYEINGQTYLFLLKQKGKSTSGHNVVIHKVNTNGSIGEVLQRFNYSEGWTNVEFYKSDGVTYRLMSKKKGLSSFKANFHIDKMNSNGTVGARVDYKKWTEGWTNVKFYENDDKMHLFLLKILKDQTAIHVMESNGEVGLEMRVQPGINIYAPEDESDTSSKKWKDLRINKMGKFKKLSPTDIDAANSLI